MRCRLMDAGIEVDNASIKSGAISTEPNIMGWPIAVEKYKRFKRDTAALAKSPIYAV